MVRTSCLFPTHFPHPCYTNENDEKKKKEKGVFKVTVVDERMSHEQE